MRNLPAWDLSDLYKDISDPKINRDLEAYRKANLAFAEKYKGRVAKLEPRELAQTLEECENKATIAKKLGAFAYLNMSTQMKNSAAAAFYQNTAEKLAEYGTPSIFFALEINRAAEKKIKEWLKDKSVAAYKPFLETLRRYKPYELPEEIEKTLVEKSVTSGSAWVRLYEEHSARLAYEIDGKSYNDAELGALLVSPDASVRKKAGIELNRVKRDNADLLAFTYNMVVKDAAVEQVKRGYKKPYSAQNLNNNVDDRVVDSLAGAVQKNYKNLSHRFYRLKAKWLGVEKLENWDRNAPLPFGDNTKYSWEEAVQIVLDAYEKFSPELHEVAKKFFENDWIDVPPRDGKGAGAFASSVSATHHPYLFLNFQGTAHDVMTLAHELGHGCHYFFSKKQGELNDATPLTLAEVASVFGEMLVFRALLEKTTDKKKRLALIASKVNDMLNTVVRQIAYHCFETRVHDERKNGELSKERLCEIWVEEIRRSLGDSVEIGKDAEYGWASIGHFWFLPFYVYAYSFADCLVNSLYKVYLDGKMKDFPDKYLEMLSQTGVKKYDELLKPFGLDANDRDFWTKGLSVVSEYIDELERLDRELGL